MTPTQLEQALRDFERIGTLVRDGRPQIWRFEISDRTYLLRFHRRRSRVARMFRGSAALREFLHLQNLQRASIPSPRAVAHLAGFRIGTAVGDALIIEEIAAAVPLDEYLHGLWLAGQPMPNRRQIAQQLVHIIHEVGSLKLGHENLTLGSFLIASGKLYFNDVGGLRPGGLRLKQVLTLGHHAARFATKTELLRGWRTLNPDAAVPRHNATGHKLWRRFTAQTRRENEQFGRLRIGEWSGTFTKNSPLAVPWSGASRLKISRDDWQAQWPDVLRQIESGRLPTLKSDASGDVLSARITLAGEQIDVAIKRPRRKHWNRYILDLFRPARAARTWQKAWMLIARNLPCEWPMLLMQKTVLGYVTDAVVIFEHVPGQSLQKIDLDAVPPAQRDMLFRRAGRTLRAIERSGLTHNDAKSTNWIVYDDPQRGPMPIMVDADSVGPLNHWSIARGIQRLLRAMRLHPQYTPADSLALCQGYAPYSGGFEQEPETP